MKSIVLLFLTTILLLGTATISNIYAQQNITNNTLAEDFEDCFLDFKSQSVYGSTQDLINLIGIACYETYKAEGKFPHQMSQNEALNTTETIYGFINSSDLDKILRAFGE